MVAAVMLVVVVVMPSARFLLLARRVFVHARRVFRCPRGYQSFPRWVGLCFCVESAIPVLLRASRSSIGRRAFLR